MHHIVMFSGGSGSWAAGKRVANHYGTDNLTLLFADTKFEDEDTYRYLHDAAANIGVEPTIVADGRDIWQVFTDEGFLANSRVDLCSRILKREICDRWITERFTPEECRIWVGIDFSEVHRLERMAARKLPYIYDSPLLWEPILTKAEIHEWSNAEGIKQQRLYDIGMPHANCGGGCVKAGQAHFRRLYENFPERYKLWEEKEQELYRNVPRTRPFLRRRIDGKNHYLSLKEFRETVLEASSDIDQQDWGGCGCFIDS